MIWRVFSNLSRLVLLSPSGRTVFMPKMQGKMAVNIKGEEEHAMRKQLKSQVC